MASVRCVLNGASQIVGAAVLGLVCGQALVLHLHLLGFFKELAVAMAKALVGGGAA